MNADRGQLSSAKTFYGSMYCMHGFYAFYSYIYKRKTCSDFPIHSITCYSNIQNKNPRLSNDVDEEGAAHLVVV